MTAPDDLRIDVVSDLHAVEALRAEWQALERRTPEATGFQSFAWCHTWLATAEAVTPGRLEARIVTVRDGGRLVMLLPLQVARAWGLRVARWIGEPLTQYGDALAEPGDDRDTWHAAAEREMRRWRGVDLLALTRLRADGVLSPGEAGACVPACVAPFIDLSRGVPETLAIVRDRGARRRERRLAATGAVELEQVTDPACASATVGQAMALKTAWLRSRRLYSTGISHPLSAPFLARFAQQGGLEVSVLRVGDAPAAIELGLVAGSAYRSLMTAYDLRYADGSPGHALTWRLVRSSAERGLRTFDLLAPSDAYKARWSDGAVALGTRTHALTLRGRVGAYAMARLRPLAKRLVLLAARRRAPSRTPSAPTTRGAEPVTA